jgi:Zn-finger nucleic acid-binding protein
MTPVACPFCGTVSVPPPRVVERVVTVDHVVEKVVVRDSAGNAATLACLRCGQPLEEGQLGATTVRQCHACGGVWLSVDAVDRLRHVSDDDLRRDVAVGEMMAMARPAQGPLACPVCDKALERVGMAETVHDVDVCKLHGTWFDRTELLAFLDREKARREAAGASDDPVPGNGGDEGFFGNLRSLFFPR